MTKSPSGAHAANRADLIRQALNRAKACSHFRAPGLTDWDVMQANKSADPDQWILDTRGGHKIVYIAWMLALPDPETAAECSEQIDSVKLGDGYGYARDHPEWGQLVMRRLAAAWGERFERKPDVITVAELRAIATGGTE